MNNDTKSIERFENFVRVDIIPDEWEYGENSAGRDAGMPIGPDAEAYLAHVAALRATLARRTDALRQAREAIRIAYEGSEVGSGVIYGVAIATIDAALADDAPHA